MAENVRVVVRCRPMNKKENEMKCLNIIQIEDCTVTVRNPSDIAAPAKTFTYDNAYDIKAPTEALYNDICYALVENVLEGYNGTIFAYGQTGCGKSHTMQGPDTNNNISNSQRGIISRSFDHIFEAISVASGVRYLALVSYLEIYNENIRDLLNPSENANHPLKELPGEGVIVPSLSTHTVHNAQECEQLLYLGGRNRVVGSTLMNAGSSRSHSIFTISLEQIEEYDENDAKSGGGIRKGKLNLVDLAGSERQNKTGAAGERLKEATKINLSLSALGNVISALVDGKTKHIPYRDSKLTRLLQDSLGGNTKTLMIACISPANYNYDETISTLRYASRAKNISNKPKINEDPKDAMLREYQEEIIKLKKMLNETHTPSGVHPIVEVDEYDIESSKQKLIDDEKLKLKHEMEQEMQRLKEDHMIQQKQKEELVRDMEQLRSHYEQQLKNITPSTPTTTPGFQLNGNSSQLDRESELHLNSDSSDIEVFQLEARKRIELIKNALIGGERANDTQLKERRQKKKLAAQRRLSALAHVLSRVEQNEDRDLLQGHYTNIQQELYDKNESLKTCRQKVKALEREVSDLQAEFQLDRADYLETIRRLERNMKFYQQLLEKALPILRKDGKYWDPDEILQNSTWNDDLKNWKFPESSMNSFRLPPAIATNTSARPQRYFSNGTKPSIKVTTNGHVDETSRVLPEDKHEAKDEDLDTLDKQSFNENILNNYFRPSRQRTSTSKSDVLHQKKGFDNWKRVLAPTSKSTSQLQSRASSSWSPYSNNNILMNKTWGGGIGESPLMAAIHNSFNKRNAIDDCDNSNDQNSGTDKQMTTTHYLRNPKQKTLTMKTMQLSPIGKMEFSLTRNKFNQKPNSYPYLGTAVPNKLTHNAYQQRRPHKVAALHGSTTTEAEQL